MFSVSSVQPLTASCEERYRRLVIKLARRLTSDDLSMLKFALRDKIPDGKMELVHKPLDIFVELEKQDIIASTKFLALRDLLTVIDRLDLVAMVDELDDSSFFRLKHQSENYMDQKGYRLAIKGGQHIQSREGELVEIQSGRNYGVTIENTNNHRCKFFVKIDGCEIAPNGLVANPGTKGILGRPYREAMKFKFFSVADAPAGSGIDRSRKEQNGLVEVVFIPERADISVFCDAQGTASLTLTCSNETTDIAFHKMVLHAFDASRATILFAGWKPLRRTGKRLVEYGIQNRSRVHVHFGLRGGGTTEFNAPPPIKNTIFLTNATRWRAGATTLQGESRQKISALLPSFPLDRTLAVTLRLRLVARRDEESLPSTGKCTPLQWDTPTPPPVPE